MKMQHTKQITSHLRTVFVSILLISVMAMTACGGTEKAKMPDVSFEDMPEFVFAFSSNPNVPDAPGGAVVTYICKNGDVLRFGEKDLGSISLAERMEKHANGRYGDFVVKTISQEEVMEHYKTLLSVIGKKGTNLLEYPEAVPAVEAPSYSWTGFYFEQGEIRYVELHKNMCMTDVSSKYDTVNGLYEWMENVR